MGCCKKETEKKQTCETEKKETEKKQTCETEKKETKKSCCG
jgi:hypothetical protein